jgi:hypothetical protein
MLYYYDDIEKSEWVDASIILIGDFPNLAMPLAISTCIEATRYLLKEIKQYRYTVEINDCEIDGNILKIKTPDDITIYEINKIFVNDVEHHEIIEEREATNHGRNAYIPLSSNRIEFPYINTLKNKKITISTTVIPSLDSEYLAKEILELYTEGIRYKAVELLYKSPSYPLNNIEMSIFYSKQYMKTETLYKRKTSVSKRTPPIAKYGGL